MWRLTAGLLAVTAAWAQAPSGWTPYPSSVSYVVGIDKENNHGGNSSAYVKTEEKQPGLIGLMQAIKAERYRGKRVRLSGYLRARSETARTRLFLQVDGEQKVVGLDAMNERAVKGNSDWKRHEIVLDVPKDAIGLRFGMLMNGNGQAWVDDLTLEMVDEKVALTAPNNGVGADTANRSSGEQGEIVKQYSKQPNRPANLDFES